MKNIFYDPKNHIDNLTDNPYYANLIKFRNVVEIACDSYFQSLKAPRIDLFMIANGISSPMGKGSDSLPIPFMLGKEHVYLVDSSQFGMEPLVQSAFDIVYCYLPSFRGEDADYRHLNQFYHCEAEIRGDYKQNMAVAENLVRYLMHDIVSAYKKDIFAFDKHNFDILENIATTDFPILTLTETEELFKKNRLENCIEYRPCGRVITSEGEKQLCKLVGNNFVPVWLTHFDRDMVPFYQKPDPNNETQTLNADLIFPSINGGFGGEIIGSGQRQDNVAQIRESIKRQNIHDTKQYDWYINMRNNPVYKTTSGFGMGMERFYAWALGLSSIQDTAIYPIIKDENLLV